MATYNVEYTSKANKNFSNLSKALVEAHCSFDPNIPADAIRVISHYLHGNYGNWLYVGGSGENEMKYRYIRVIIDIPAGSKTSVEKQELLRRILECCMDYEGKKADECDIEVRVNEIDQSNVMKIDATSKRH